MAEFGQPARTATSDANAGLVNPPAMREANRTATTQSVKAVSDIDGAAKNLGRSLGTAFTKLLGNKAQNINAQRALDASIKQGDSEARDSVAEGNKRTGWKKAMYGESPEYQGYRESQQRGVMNGVQQDYIEAANTVSESAADTPEQYAEKLRAQLDTKLTGYESDPETQQLITQAWAKASGNLVRSQYKEHTAFALEQNRKETEQGIRGTFDTFTTDAKNITSEAEATDFHNKAKAFFSGAAKPPTADPVAYSGMMKAQLAQSIAGGNIGMLNMAKEFGFLKNYNAKEQQVLDTAINKYDIKASNAISLSVAEARTAFNNVSGPDAHQQYLDLKEEAMAALDEHAERGSGTAKYDLSIQNGKNSIDALLKPAEKKAIEAEVAAARFEDVIDAQAAAGEGDGGKLYDISPTKEESVAAAQERTKRLVMSITGDEELTNREVASAIFSQPVEVGSRVVDMWADSTSDGGLVKTLGKAYIGGYATEGSMVDENGQPTEAAQNAMQVFAQFESADRAKFSNQLGQDAYNEYQIISEGQQQGKTADMIGRDVAEYHKNIENNQYFAADWNDVGVGGKDGLTKREYMSNLISGFTKQNAEAGDIGDYLAVYGKALTASRGDHAAAKQAVHDATKNKAIMYDGVPIHGAESINKILPNYTVPALLDAIQQPDQNLMTGLIAIGMGKTEDENGIPIRNTKTYGELKGTMTYKMAPNGGMWMDSTKFQSPVLITPEHFHAMDNFIKQRSNAKQLKAEIEKQSFLNRAQQSTDAQNRTAR